MSGANNGPLAGLKVVDLTSVVVGPICTRTLADQGADVIKVESLEGDLLRQLGGRARNPGMSGKFINFNRNKRAICLDLKSTAGREAMLRLVQTADIFVTNIRPGAMDRLGLGWVAMQARNPRLIHCLILGFGRGGRYCDKPAYDTVIQGVSGIADAFSQSNGAPRYVPMVMCDHTTGLIAAQCIGFALYRREKTGVGEAIEVPMFENMAGFVMAEHMGAMSFDPPLGPPGDARLLSKDARPLATKDGFLSLSANTDAQAFGLFRAIGRPALKDDPRFCSVAARTANTPAYFALRTEALREKTTAEWLALLAAEDVPAMPCTTLAGLPDDPHLQDVGFFLPEDHPTEGPMTRFRPANQFSGGMREGYLHSPRLGENTAEVLAEAGYDETEVAAMLASGAARQA